MYRLTDLAESTGVTPWTLRSWVRKGILHRCSGGRGANAFYDQTHKRRVEQIKCDLWDGRVSIADLRDRYNPVDDDE